MRLQVIAVLCALAAAGGILVAAAPGGMSEAAEKDEEAIRAVVQLYFDGIIQYDEGALRKAFHPKASVIGMTKEGAEEWDPFQEWVVYTRGEAPDPTGRNNRIVAIDITGRAAVVKTELDWPHVRYVDYLSLLKLDGDWKIVNKIWHREKPSAEG